LGTSSQGRTSYRKKNTREYRYLLDDQIGFGKKTRIDPLLKALILERATELSSQKAGREGRTSYRKKNTREYRYLLDGQVGFRKKTRIDPLLKALILERATELPSQKAGREILPQNQECTVSPEVVKRLVHHLREEEKKAEEIPEKKW